MADVSKEVKIIFEGVDNVSDIIGNVSTRLEDFGGKVTSATQPLADLAATVLKTEAALAALAVGGLVLAFNESKKFEAAQLELAKVLSDEEIPRLEEAKQAAFNLSDQYGQSSSEIIQSIAEWRQAGFDLNDSLKLTAASMDLVIAGNLSAADANAILVATLKGFKSPAEDAARLTDILNAVSNEYATNVLELGKGMAGLSPIAKTMGFSFEETAGLLTPVIEVFRSGDEAAIALKTGLLKLIDDTPAVTEALKSIGVSQTDSNGALRSGKDILYDVAAAFVNLDDNQKLFITQQLVGIQQSARMVEVFNGLSKSTEVTAVAMNAAGSAAKEVEIRLGSAEVAVDRFIRAAQNLAIAVGFQFQEAAKEAIDGGTAIENALRGMVDDGTFAPILDLVRSFASSLGADLKQIAQILPEAFEGVDWTKLIDSLGTLGEAVKGIFKAAFGDVDLTTAEGLQKAVQKIVDSVAALTNVTAGILEAWQPFVRAISDAVDTFNESGEATQTFVGNVLGFAQAVNTFASNIDIITKSLQAVALALTALNITNLAGAVGGFTALGTAVVNFTASIYPLPAILATVATGLAIDWLFDKIIPGWDQLRLAVASNVDVLHGFDDAQGEWIGSADDVEETLSNQKTIWEELSDAIDAMPPIVETQVSAPGAALTKQEIDEISKAFAEVTEDKTITVTAEADEGSFKRVGDIIIEELPDGRIVFTQAKLDQSSVDATKSKLDQDIPTEKQIEIRLQGEIDIEIAKIQAQAESLQSYFEWSAKVDIAEIEQVFETIRNQSDNITEMFVNTGDVLVGLASSLGDISSLARLEVFELMEAEAERRDALLVEQQKLTEAQIKYLEARTSALGRGESIITIQDDGLQAELELVLQRIIELTQIRANEEGLNFLLGVT